MTIRSFVLLFCFLASFSVSASSAVWTIAIDPGHGGKDPGAIGGNLHIYEKNVTLAIARELKALLDKDPNFRGVLTRQGDYYISVPERSEIARKYKANYLISIHADSSLSPELRGASVWILSNRRANDEMGQWLEDDEKRSELLGGAGKVLATHNDKYLDQTVLDLQFGHSQRTGYEIGKHILVRFAKVTALSRSTPQHASLGVLRSPDIPSVLVETGYLSNREEEAKLNTPEYRRRIARMIYEGLIAYRNSNLKDKIAIPGAEAPENASTAKNNRKNDRTLSAAAQVSDSGIRHEVKSGEGLNGLARKYGVSVSEIQRLNKLQRDSLRIGEIIRIPAGNNGRVKTTDGNAAKNDHTSTAPYRDIKDSGIRHQVKAGESLGSLANQYQVGVSDLIGLNNLKRSTLWVGETLKIPDNGKNRVNQSKPMTQSTSVTKKAAPSIKNKDKSDKHETKKTANKNAVKSVVSVTAANKTTAKNQTRSSNKTNAADAKPTSAKDKTGSKREEKGKRK